MSDNTEAVQNENQEAIENENQSLLNPEIPEKKENEVDETPPTHLNTDDDAEPTVKSEEEVQAEETKKERPQNISEAHWDKDKGEVKVDELAKSYEELRNKMAAGKHKPPKDGVYKTDFVEGLEEDDTMMNEFQTLAKDNNMSQELFEQLTNFYLESQGAVQQEVKYKQEEEMAKLGNNAPAIIKSTNDWLTKFVSTGVLAQNEIEAIADASTNAAFISGLNKIRRSYGEKTIPTASTHELATTTKSDIEAMMRDERYGVDEAYTEKVEKAVYEMHGEKY